MTTVGQILKKERESKGLLLSDIEKKIRIREKYLVALESDDWNYFSSKIYIIGLLKNYSRILDLDSKKILAFFRRDYERKEEVKFKEKISSSYLISNSSSIIKFLIILSFIFIFIYFGYQLKLYFTPPSLKIIAPISDNFTTETKINIIGKTDKDAMVTVMGNRLYQDKLGQVNYEFPLQEGTNKVTFEIVGANGKKSTVVKIYYKSSPK